MDEKTAREQFNRIKSLNAYHHDTTPNLELRALYNWATGALSFFDGEWQWHMPQAEGRYWVCTRDGDVTGPLTVVKHLEGFYYCTEHPVYEALVGYGRRTSPGTSWSGMWWSRPIPTPPKNMKIATKENG